MKIILTQTGGLLGRTKTASAVWPYPAEKFNELLHKVRIRKKDHAKDGYAYFIHTDHADNKIPVSIDQIDDVYEELFDELFKNLKLSEP